MKKSIALALTLLMLAAVFAGCAAPSSEPAESVAANAPAAPAAAAAAPAQGGTLIYLSSMTSGKEHEAAVAMFEMMGKELGYSISVVYGDMSNDPAANLQAVQNAMTDDVVGLIVSQSGGVSEMMAEYPDLYVVGTSIDLNEVYGEGGLYADLLENDKFLGTIGNALISGSDIGKLHADYVLKNGFKKVATMMFPPFAFPQFAAADAVLRGEIAAYNQSAADADKIEIVGDAQVLMFAAVDDNYFMESAHQDLDCIVVLADGIQFVYPALKNAVDAGTMNPNVKMITGGFSSEPGFEKEIIDGLIGAVYAPAVESCIYSMVVMDNALQGKPSSDFEPLQVDGPYLFIETAEQRDAVLNNSIIVSASPEDAAMSWEEIKQHLTRFNESATQSNLIEAVQGVSVASYS